MRRRVLSFCHVSLIVRAAGSTPLTTERNVSQYPSGNDGSPETSIRQPDAPARIQRFAMLAGAVRKYAWTSGQDLARTGIESNPNQPS